IENADTTDDGQNIIFNNVQAGNIFDLFNNCTNDIYAQNNDWRVYDSTSIEGHVVHKVDDPVRGYVFFMPFSDSIYIPVELTGFNCNAEGNNILIEWSTATETNNRGFEIERSIVTSSEFEIWNKIVFVQGSGTTTEANNYSYTDKNLSAGKYRYRLKQIDYDGSFNYSNIVEVDVVIPGEFILYQNYPNPFNPVTLIKYVIPGNVETLHATSLRIVDILGKNVATIVNELQEPGIYEVEWDASSYPSGIYFYQLQVGSFIETKRMLLLK
ncbi:MAG TPA: T9SS type A sorting domain-containing protein, partial [Ignavibacteriaceae bacterium]|nr:T9SS type A sorting domain-containing protein [Ignavibacteriaceae bacterium]